MAGTLDTSRFGPVMINRIRFGLVTLYTLSIAGSVPTNTLIQNIAYTTGTGLMLGYALLFYFWNRYGQPPSWLPRSLLVLDTTILIGVMSAGVVNTPEAAKSVLSSVPLTSIFFFYIIASAFIRSRNFVIIMGLYSAAGSAFVSVLALTSGLEYTQNLELSRGPTHATLSNEILKALFMLGAAAIVRMVISVIVHGEGAEQALQESRAAYDNLQSKEDRMQASAEKLHLLTSKIELLTTAFNDQFQTQAASLQQISAAMEELSASAENSLDTVRQQYERMDRMTGESDQLEAGFNKIIDSTDTLRHDMEAARGNSEEVTDVVTEARRSFQQIQDSFQRVNDVNQIMADIADKTNLLALNASIEAARAGEHGRGFSVVAEEVSRLADNSSVNARTISQIIGESGDLIHSGGEVTDRAIALVEQQQQKFAGIAASFQTLGGLIQNQRDINQHFLEVIKELRIFSSDLEKTAVEQKEGTQNIAGALGELDGAISGLVSRAAELTGHLNSLEEQARVLEEG